MFAAKRTKIEELCAIQDVSPPPLTFKSPLSTDQIEDLKAVYSHTYAPALDKFFETDKWFQKWGLIRLLNNPRLCEQFTTMLVRFSIEATRHYQIPNTLQPPDLETQMTKSLEATVVWAMMRLARPLPDSQDLTEAEIEDGVFEAAERSEIIEHLLLGEHLDAKPHSELRAERNGDLAHGDTKQRNRKEFWRHVRTFLTLHDDEASAAKEIDDTLTVCRTVLDSLENRDLIYSIIIARHIGQRMTEFPNSLPQSTTNDEADNRNKLHVAKTFIENEQKAGTTQIVQRVCNMVVRSWSLPR